MKKLTVFLLAGSITIPAVCFAENELEQQSAVSQAFQAFMNGKSQAAARQLYTVVGSDVPPNGYIPSPQDYSHLKGATISASGKMALSVVTLPVSYDLRSLGRVTSVKNQGSCGSCWAFAATASFESSLLIGQIWDFSENNLKNTSGFDWGHCDGGNSDMATAYFARWGGAISETDDPYSATSNVSPVGLTVRRHLKDVHIIPPRTSSTDNDGIKQAIMNYGAVTTYIYSNSSSTYYKSATSSYYYNGTSGMNHAVTIVGWDDSYSASNFATVPPGNGAFIVKNSWGTGWGSSGYFYISYYDTNVGDSVYAFVAESSTSATTIYQYDQLGQIGSTGYGSTTGWFANIFTAQNNEDLISVALYTLDVNAAYDIYVHKGVSAGAPRSGTLMAHQTGSITYPGYHVVMLSTPVNVSTGDRFSVVAKVTNPTYVYPIPTEYAINGYSSQAAASTGQSYTSSAGTTWSDAATSSSKNVCVKAFAADVTAPVVSLFTLPATSSSLVVPITAFTATDLVGVTGYYVGESSTKPSSSASGWTVSAPSSYSFSSTGSKTLYAFAKDIAGNVSSGIPAPVNIAVSNTLTLSVSGTGAGRVTSTPGGIDCSLATCPSAQFPSNSIVTLHVTPDSNSLFIGWGAACAGTNDCTITMDSAKSVTALITSVPPVKVGLSTYNTLTQALSAAAGGLEIQSRAVVFSESVSIGVDVKLQGGFDTGFNTNNGSYSTLNGTLLVGKGILTVENLVIQ